MTYYGQRNPLWRNITVGNTNRTLGSIGCTTCTIADASSWFGKDINPGVLAKRLEYTPDAYLLWGSLSKIGLKLALRFRKYDKAIIADALKDPKKTVAFNVDNGAHWVFGLRDLGFGKYLVHDPWNDRRTIYGGVTGGAVISNL